MIQQQNLSPCPSISATPPSSKTSWLTPELRALFDDAALAAGWVEVMAVSAQTQAEFGLIPEEAARQLAEACKTVALDEAFFTEAREGIFERATIRCWA